MVLRTLNVYSIIISTNINGVLHLSGRAAVIFVEIIIEYTFKVRSTVILNRTDIIYKKTDIPSKLIRSYIIILFNKPEKIMNDQYYI